MYGNVCICCLLMTHKLLFEYLFIFGGRTNVWKNNFMKGKKNLFVLFASPKYAFELMNGKWKSCEQERMLFFGANELEWTERLYSQT